MENKQRFDETIMYVTSYETSLISGILHIVLANLKMDGESRKRVQDFRTKLLKAALSINKRNLEP